MTAELPPQAGSQQPHKGDVLLYVEQEAPSKFKIESDQLERIGAKLRGPRRFSIFYSLVLPALVTLLTTILTGTFQYLSWINTVRLQAASGIADRAAETFDKAAIIVGQRSYATLIFIPSVRDLSKSKLSKPSLPAVAANDKGDRRQAAASGPQFDLASVATAPTGTEFRLNTVSEELAKQRYMSYYEHLKHWNEQYDQLLADIDYNLDHPILADAGIHRTAITVFYNKLKKIDCSKGLTDELEKAGLDKHSLKLQFAAINRCFGAVHSMLDEQQTKLLHNAVDNIEPNIIQSARDRLDDIATMTNEFRCVALLRIGYYKRQKEKSIILPTFVRHWLFDPAKADAEAQFGAEDRGCNPENRPT